MLVKAESALTCKDSEVSRLSTVRDADVQTGAMPFRDLEGGYAPGRDVYGNRDLAAYEKGRQDVARIAKGFDNVPQAMREFYVARLAGEMIERLRDQSL